MCPNPQNRVSQSTKQCVQPKNWKILNKLSHWNHFCSNGWKILPMSTSPEKKSHFVRYCRSLSEKFTIKMKGNKMLPCAVPILQVSLDFLILLTVSKIFWFYFQEKHILTLIGCFSWSLIVKLSLTKSFYLYVCPIFSSI